MGGHSTSSAGRTWLQALLRVASRRVGSRRVASGRRDYLVQRRQPVYVGVVDVSSLPQQRRHLLPIPGGAGGHEHGPLREANLGPPRPRNAQGVPALRPSPIRLRAQPSLQLILPSLFGSFGPGMVSSRHLPWCDSAHGARRSGADGLGRGSSGRRPLADALRRCAVNFRANFSPRVAFRVSSEILHQAHPRLHLYFLVRKSSFCLLFIRIPRVFGYCLYSPAI